MVYDLVIVGAGPAGLSAALTATYLRLNHIVLESSLAGGALIQDYPWKKVYSFLGIREEKGRECAKRMVGHVLKEGSKIREKDRVVSIKKKDRIFSVITCNGNKYKAKSVIIATGTMGSPRKLEIPGEKSPNVHYSLCEIDRTFNPKMHKGKDVLVVGGGDCALEEALELDKSGANVAIAHRRDSFRGLEKTRERVKKSGIKIFWNTELKKINDNSRRTAVLYNNRDKSTKKESFDEILISIGSVVDTGLLEKTGVDIRHNHAVVDDDLQTNIEGLFAAGDITGRLKRIPEAVGEGHLAVYSAYKYVKKPYWA